MFKKKVPLKPVAYLKTLKPPKNMLRKEMDEILTLIKREVVPAIGCTEPTAVALAVAKAKEVLDEMPLKIEVFLSANILKNSMGVGIPGTGMVGLPIAIALGAIIGKSEYSLEVLRDLTPETLELAKQMVEGKSIFINLKKDVPDKLYIEVHCYTEHSTSKVIICSSHAHIAYVEKDGKVLMDTVASSIGKEKDDSKLPLSFHTICDFTFDIPLEEIQFMQKAAELNKMAAAESKKGSFGHNISRIVDNSSHRNIMGDSIYTRIMSVTASACDVRMAGAMIPVMSNSGSGNQGLTATLPVVVFAEETGKSNEELIRALTLSHLMVIYIKRNLGRLSGLCGVTVAGIGASCGITYLMGGNREQIANSIKNMIGNLTGVICDGAKPSCALKVSTAVSTATISSLMAMENQVVTSLEGIADDDVDKTIRNLTDIGSVGMNETDKMVLKIMTDK
jgi:L-cysteine desulfidase